MKPFAPILAAALALSGCMASDRLSGSVTHPILDKMLAIKGPTFRLPHTGGHLETAKTLSDMANILKLTLVIDGPLVSSSVLAARMVHRVHVVDRNARWMGLHLAAQNGTPHMAESRRMYADKRAPGCMDWYLRQPEARGNRVVYVSWDFMEGNCHE
jgi:hypothetical protein